MDKALIDNWNQVVTAADMVFIIGDFAWKRAGDYADKLAGTKVLILGSHDKLNVDDRKRFTGIHDILHTRFGNTWVTLCHYGMSTWPHKQRGAIHLYGHSHGVMPEDDVYDRRMDVGVDVWGYAPVPWDAIGWYLTSKLPRDPRPESMVQATIKRLRARNLALRTGYDARKGDQNTPHIRA